MVAAGNSSFTVHIGYWLLVWDTHKNCRPILWFTLYLVFVNLNWLKVPPRVTCKENTWKCLQVVVGTSCYYCLYLWPWMARFIVSLRKTKAAYMLITCLVHLVQNIFYLFADHFLAFIQCKYISYNWKSLMKFEESIHRVYYKSHVSSAAELLASYICRALDDVMSETFMRWDCLSPGLSLHRLISWKYNFIFTVIQIIWSKIKLQMRI